MTLPPKSPGDVLQEITRSHAGMLEKLFRDLPSAGTADMAALMRIFATADGRQLEKLRALEETFYRDHLSLWGQLSAPADDATIPVVQSDNRFGAPEWGLPYFRYLQQAYLLNADRKSVV